MSSSSERMLLRASVSGKIFRSATETANQSLPPFYPSFDRRDESNRCLLPTPKFVTHAGPDPEDICVFPCRSFLASLFEKTFAVINIAVNVMLRRVSCCHPFSIDALPISVRPAKQNRRWTQKTCSEDCPNSTRGLIAAVFVIGCERISNAATAAKSSILIGPRCHLSKKNSNAPSSKPCASFRRMMKQRTATTTAGIAARLAHVSIARFYSRIIDPNLLGKEAGGWSVCDHKDHIRAEGP
jgi:hypothetical protein